MWLILCYSTDAAALWVRSGLVGRGLKPIELILADTLTAGPRFEHRVSNGGVCTTVRFPGGRTIRDVEVQGTLNRLQYAPVEELLFSPSDRDYVRQEMYSFFLSWLSALPGPMLNRPTAFGLSGQWRHSSEWVFLAASAGLPVPGYAESAGRGFVPLTAGVRLASLSVQLTTVLLIAGTVIGPTMPAPIAEGCRRLAGLSQTAILGVEFCPGIKSEWTFAGVTTHPDLRLGGPAALEALERALRDGTEPPR